jgi:Domain of unknown function (DUF4397)
MNLSRVAAIVAVPVALSLAACGGGSSGFVNNNIGTAGQQANIRFVNGSPDLGSNIDVYFQATGAAAPGAPAAGTTTNVPYGVITPFIQESPVAGTVTVRAAGASSSSAALLGLACPIPQMATNAKYTVAIAGSGATHTCLVFQDFDYNAAPQYRVHNASLNAPASIAYTTTGTPTTTPATYSSAQVAARGGNAAAAGTTYTQVQPAGPIGNPTDPTFVIGANTGGPTFPVTVSLEAKYLFSSGSLAQPNTSGTLNFPSTAGTSVFAIDCAAPPATGVQCNGGIALIGTFDTL